MVALSYRTIPINKCRRDDRNRKVSVSKHLDNNCRQESSMVAKISGQKSDEKQDVYIVSKYLPTDTY